MKISVIVPVYNMVPWLRRCLDSLQRQTFDDIEIICVNDGSTDDSLTILCESAAQDGRIKVIDQPNGGLSAARNAGVAAAAGDYLMFVDADDWVEPNFCAAPLQVAEKMSADIVVFHCRKAYSVGHYECTSVVSGFKEEWGPECDRIGLLTSWLAWAVWNKMWLRSFWQKKRLTFPVRTRWEDSAVSWEGICEAERIIVMDQVLYNYVVRQGSMSRNGTSETDWESIPRLWTHLQDRMYHKPWAKRYEIVFCREILMRCRMTYYHCPNSREKIRAWVSTFLAENELRTQTVFSSPLIRSQEKLFLKAMRGDVFAQLVEPLLMVKARLMHKTQGESYEN